MEQREVENSEANKKRYVIIIVILVIITIFAPIAAYRVFDKRIIQMTDVSSYVTDGYNLFILYGGSSIEKWMPEVYTSLKQGRFQEAEQPLEHFVEEQYSELTLKEQAILKNALAIIYMETGKEYEAKKLIDEALALAKEADDQQMQAALYNTKGCIINAMIDLIPAFKMDDVIDVFDHAKETCDALPEMERLVVQTNALTYDLQTIAGLENKANTIRQVTSLIKEEQKLLGSKQLITIYNYFILADMYEYFGQYKQAESYYLKALKLNGRLVGGDINRELVNGYIYAALGLLYVDMGDSKKGEEVINKAIAIHESMPSNYKYLGGDYLALAVIHSMRQEYDTTIKYYHETLKYFRPESYATGEIYSNISSVYYYKKDYQESLSWRVKGYRVMKRFYHVDQTEYIESIRNLYNLTKPEEEWDRFDQWLEEQAGADEEFLQEETDGRQNSGAERRRE